MDDQPVTIAEEVVAALVIGLLRRGVIDESDIREMAQGLSDEAGHLLNALVVEAAAPTQSDWSAEQRRKRFRLVPSGPEAK